MDVTTTTNDLLARMEEGLSERSQRVSERLGTSRERLEQGLARIRERWQQIEEIKSALTTDIEQREGEVGQAAEQLAAGIEEARTTLSQALERGESLFESSRDAVSSLEGRVEALIPEAREAFATVQKTIETLGTEMDGLDRALESTRALTDGQLQNEFSKLVDGASEEGLQRASRLWSYVDDDFVPGVTGQLEELKQKIDAAVSTATESFDRVRESASTGSEQVMHGLRGACEEEFGTLIETAERLRDLSQRIGDLVSTAGDTAGTATQLMGQSVDSVSIGAKAAIGIVEDLIDIFESVT